MAKKEEIHMPYVTSIEEVTREEMASTMLEAGEPDKKILAYAKISREELNSRNVSDSKLADTKGAPPRGAPFPSTFPAPPFTVFSDDTPSVFSRRMLSLTR